MGGGGICEKRNTHTRQNLTIQQGNRPATAVPAPSRGTRGWASLYPLWEKTNSQPPSPFPTRGAWFKGAGPSHLRQGNRPRPGWKQGPEGAESGWGSAKSRDGGSEAGTRGTGGPARDPSILGSPGHLAALAEQSSRPPPRRTRRSSPHAA